MRLCSRLQYGATLAVVQNGDGIRGLRTLVYDGSTSLYGPGISVSVDGTPSLGDVRGDLVFKVDDDGVDPTTMKLISDRDTVMYGPGALTVRRGTTSAHPDAHQRHDPLQHG